MNRPGASLLAVCVLAGAAWSCADDESGEKHAGREPNRLIHEKSVYLRQHAYNPVDWYPWGDEAFEKARREQKPVLLSIGYSTCHWCHVMERESFEDEEIAAFLNQHFVSVKVDREERPDVDSVYMDYVQALRGSGGWPLTVFLTPERVPFFGGTYYPPRARGGSPGFLDVLTTIHREWTENRERLLASGEQVVELLKARADLALGEGELSRKLLENASRRFADAFDPKWGGTRGAPKFPQPMMLQLLLRCEKLLPDERALEMVTRTLHGMADGGIHDQLGGGFARYSVDERWHVPHFEKMLYTQALLARVYAEAWQRTKEARFEQVARDTLDYVLRDMRVEGGAFAAAEDADSSGEEGLFYTWTPAEIREALDEPLAEIAIAAFGVTEGGHLDGRSVLYRARTEGLDPDEVERAREALFEARATRERPLRDDKILVSWNALMISALAFCGRAFDEPSYLEAAEEAAEFLRRHLVLDDGRVLRRFREGHAQGPGYLDDHAYLAQALIDLYEAGFRLEWLELAARITDAALQHFEDPDTHTFFQTPKDAESLLLRPRDAADGALPSATAVMARNLLRLSDALGDESRKERALACLRNYGQAMQRAPLGYSELISAYAWTLEPPRHVVFAGEAGSEPFEALVRRFYREFVPVRFVAHAPVDDAGRARAEELMEVVKDKLPRDGKPAVYWCENFTCRAPITDPDALFPSDR